MGGGRPWRFDCTCISLIHLQSLFVIQPNSYIIFISKTNHDIGLLLLCPLFVPMCQYSVNSFSKADHLIPAAL